MTCKEVMLTSKHCFLRDEKFKNKPKISIEAPSDSYQKQL